MGIPKMGNMVKMMKQAHQMRRIQKELERRTYEAVSPNAQVRVVARGDMSVKSITLDPAFVQQGNIQRLEKVLVSTVNSALDSCKKAAAGDMSKLTDGMGLGGLFGGG